MLRFELLRIVFFVGELHLHWGVASLLGSCFFVRELLLPAFAPLFLLLLGKHGSFWVDDSVKDGILVLGCSVLEEKFDLSVSAFVSHDTLSPVDHWVGSLEPVKT